MHKVLYATGNKVKFNQARHVCDEFNITLIQHDLDVPEIQSENATAIAMDKAEKAYNLFQQPLIISDDSWAIPGLNGFPGPYMKSMAHWFRLEDWLRLTAALTDRRVILTQVAVYQDADGPILFSSKIEGVILTEARGVSTYAHNSIFSFDGGTHSNAEFHERGEPAATHVKNVWHDFAVWYIKYNKI